MNGQMTEREGRLALALISLIEASNETERAIDDFIFDVESSRASIKRNSLYKRFKRTIAKIERERLKKG